MCIVNIDSIQRQKKAKRILFDETTNLLWIFDFKFWRRIHGNDLAHAAMLDAIRGNDGLGVSLTEHKIFMLLAFKFEEGCSDFRVSATFIKRDCPCVLGVDR